MRETVTTETILVTDAPRLQRTRLFAKRDTLGLYLVAPSVVGGDLWRYALLSDGRLTVLGHGATSRDKGMEKAERQFGKRATLLRKPVKAAA